MAPESHGRWPLVGSAFLLPFRWVPERPHSPLLPPAVAAEAARVLRVLGRVPGMGYYGPPGLTVPEHGDGRGDR